MSAQRENRFIQAVHRYLPDDVYHEKMHNMYRGGTPDVWYSSIMTDMWVEYKCMAAMPVRKAINPADSKEFLSVLQQNWLTCRHAEGRNVAVIIGCPQGGVIFRGLEWKTPLSTEEFVARVVDKKTVAAWIVRATRGERDGDQIEAKDLRTAGEAPASRNRANDLREADGDRRDPGDSHEGTQRRSNRGKRKAV